jgi:hypothetical protein
MTPGTNIALRRALCLMHIALVLVVVVRVAPDALEVGARPVGHHLGATAAAEGKLLLASGLALGPLSPPDEPLPGLVGRRAASGDHFTASIDADPASTIDLAHGAQQNAAV